MKYGFGPAASIFVTSLLVTGIAFGQAAGHQSFTGTLRDISSSEISLRTNDRQMVTLKLAGTTRFLRQSRAPIGFADFNPGDQVTVDATQDDGGVYHAVSLTLLQEGTPADRPAVSSSGSRPGTASGGNNSSSDDDPDRPRLTRRNSAPASSSSASPDPDDPGPPRLARGVPSRSSDSGSGSSGSNQVAQNRPSIGAQEVNGVTQREAPPVVGMPDPEPAVGGGYRESEGPGMPSSGDPIVDKAREAAFAFSETLPNYIVKQLTTRYATRAATGKSTTWQALDNISADVVYENGKESYKNLQINGRPSKLAPEETGSWSTGEFATMMQAILAPQTDATFRNKRSATIVNRAAWRYDFSVQQVNSGWHVTAEHQTYDPAYAGSIWVDQENFRVLRIEQSANGMPRSFPLDTVESAVDYDYVIIGSAKFLLPVHSEALSCERGTSDCTRNTIDFRNYRKFNADSEIIFDTPDPDTNKK